MFSGLLKIRARCSVCDLDLSAVDSGDGPASLAVFAVGAIVVGLAFWMEFRFDPPGWVHLVVWPPMTVGLTVGLMRPLKAGLAALQFRHRQREMGL